MTVKQSYPRLRAVRPKAGGYIRLLPDRREKVARELRAEMDGKADNFWANGPVAGYALVVWYADGGTYTACNNSDLSPYAGSSIPAMVEGCVHGLRTQDQIDKTLYPDEDEAS